MDREKEPSSDVDTRENALVSLIDGEKGSVGIDRRIQTEEPSINYNRKAEVVLRAKHSPVNGTRAIEAVEIQYSYYYLIVNYYTVKVNFEFFLYYFYVVSFINSKILNYFMHFLLYLLFLSFLCLSNSCVGFMAMLVT